MDEQQNRESEAALCQVQPALTPSLDATKYRPFLAPMELAPEQEDQLLGTLWSMMTVFVDQAFGLDPVQTTLLEHSKSSLPDGEIVVEEKSNEQPQEVLCQSSVKLSEKDAPP